MLAISSTVPCASQVSNHCMFLWVGLCPCNGNADSVKKYLICVKVYNMVDEQITKIYSQVIQACFILMEECMNKVQCVYIKED